jgi:hypothetical protein
MFQGKVVGTAGFWSAATFVFSTAIAIGDFKWSLGAKALYVVTACLLVYGVVELSSLPFSMGRRLQAFGKLRFGGLMPLRVATKLAYQEARANKTLWAAAAERLAAEKTPDGILNYVGTYFGTHVPIYGARPPSDQLEEIPKNMASNGRMTGGASRLYEWMSLLHLRCSSSCATPREVWMREPKRT